MVENKRENGQYFTRGNCFKFDAFKEWFESIPNNGEMVIVEPFAGGGNIPVLMNDAGYNNAWEMYDLYPKTKDIIKRNSILSCPKADCIVTNPPYLAKNSATRRGLYFPDTHYDDLYKFALDKMLSSASHVAAIIPESFITSNLFTNRVSTIISIKMKMFDDTDCPVCLALFSGKCNDAVMYNENEPIGKLSDLRKFLPTSHKHNLWEFNRKGGDIGLIAIDNTKTDTIRFVDGNSILNDDVKVSSRAKTRILGKGRYCVDDLIDESNGILKEIRNMTQDVFLTSFKGIRKDGKYRRRLDFGIARLILDCAWERL